MTVVITGAASGMGRACVDRLRGTVDHVVAVDLTAPDIDGAVGVACDVSDVTAVTALAEQVHGLGDFTGLVHAAGISPTMGDVRRVFAVDLLGTELLLDARRRLVRLGHRRADGRRDAGGPAGPGLGLTGPGPR